MDQKYFDAKFETIVVMIKDLTKDVGKINGRTAKSEESIRLLQLSEQEFKNYKKRTTDNTKFVRWAIVSLAFTVVGTLLFIIFMKG